MSTDLFALSGGHSGVMLGVLSDREHRSLKGKMEVPEVHLLTHEARHRPQGRYVSHFFPPDPDISLRPVSH